MPVTIWGLISLPLTAVAIILAAPFLGAVSQSRAGGVGRSRGGAGSRGMGGGPSRG